MSHSEVARKSRNNTFYLSSELLHTTRKLSNSTSLKTCAGFHDSDFDWSHFFRCPEEVCAELALLHARASALAPSDHIPGRQIYSCKLQRWELMGAGLNCSPAPLDVCHVTGIAVNLWGQGLGGRPSESKNRIADSQ